MTNWLLIASGIVGFLCGLYLIVARRVVAGVVFALAGAVLASSAAIRWEEGLDVSPSVICWTNVQKAAFACKELE